MRRILRAGLIICFAALPFTEACATPSQNNPSATYAGASPIGNGSGTSPSAGSASTSGAPVNEFNTTGYTVDSAESKALSDYLTQHKLPLVGAQVMRGPEAQRGVVLYGFVGSDFGKQDAVSKARNFLSDPTVAVNNRIKVKPELLAADGASGSEGANGTTASDSDGAGNNGAPAPSYPGPDSYTQNQQSEAQQYVQNQHNNATLSAMAPMLMIGMMALSVASGGAFSVGSGAIGPPGFSTFGGPPPSQYPGFPSPSPYSPFGP